MSENAGKASLIRSFPRTFWLANMFELFERGAYYGLNALLARYLTDKVGGGLGFAEDKVGLLQGIVYAVTYVVPILGGALAGDRERAGSLRQTARLAGALRSRRTSRGTGQPGRRRDARCAGRRSALALRALRGSVRRVPLRCVATGDRLEAEEDRAAAVAREHDLHAALRRRLAGGDVVSRERFSPPRAWSRRTSRAWPRCPRPQSSG